MRFRIWGFLGIILIIVGLVMACYVVLVLHKPVKDTLYIETTTEEEKRHHDYSFRDIDRGDIIVGEYRWKGGTVDSVDFYILDDTNYKELDKEGGNVVPEYENLNSTYDSFEVEVPHSGRWWLVWENDQKGRVVVDIKVEPIYNTINIPFIGKIDPWLLFAIILVIVGIIFIFLDKYVIPEEKKKEFVKKEEVKAVKPTPDIGQLNALEKELEGMLEKKEPKKEVKGEEWILLRELEKQLKILLEEKEFKDEERLRHLKLLEYHLEKLLEKLGTLGKREEFKQLRALEEELKRLLTLLELLKESRSVLQIEELKRELGLLLKQLNNLESTKGSQKAEQLRMQLLKLIEEVLWCYEKHLRVLRGHRNC